MPDQAPYETLSIYGFKLDYPSTMRVEFNPKSHREEGDVAFKSQQEYRVFLSWGPLDKVLPKLASTLDHAKYSIERIKHGGEASDVSDATFRDIIINGHYSTRSSVKLAMVKRTIFFGKNKMPREAHSFHIHCETTRRYFVLYAYALPEYSEQEQSILDNMASTFVCH